MRQKIFTGKSSTDSTSNKTAASSDETTTSTSTSKLIANLPEEIPYLLIGGGTASFGATRAIRVNDPKSKIIIVSNEKWKPYLRPPLSKEIWLTPPDIASKLLFRQYNGTDKNIHYEHEEFYHSLEKLAAKETGGVSIINDITVTKIDTTERIAYFSNGQKIKFGKCLLATGGQDVKVNALHNLPSKLFDEKVIYYRKLDDFSKLLNIFEDKSSKGKTIAIIGGQFLGTELTTVLSRRSIYAGYGINITQIIEGPGVLSKILPDYLSKYVTLKVMKEGPQLITDVSVTDAKSIEDSKIQLSLSNGTNVIADWVIVADPLVKNNSSGIEIVDNNINLAKESNLEIDKKLGGFVANSELQVKSNVYTAGDAANFFDYFTQERKKGGHHDFAIASGRHAGQNMTGKCNDFKYTPFYWSDIGPDVSIEAVGDINSSYETTGVFLNEPITSLTFSSKNDDDEKEDKVKDTINDESKKVITSEGNKKTSDTEYERGVVFYYKNKKLVGILMINLFNKVHLSRRILQNRSGVTQFDPTEIAKLYHLYSIED